MAEFGSEEHRRKFFDDLNESFARLWEDPEAWADYWSEFEEWHGGVPEQTAELARLPVHVSVFARPTLDLSAAWLAGTETIAMTLSVAKASLPPGDYEATLILHRRTGDRGAQEEKNDGAA